MPFLGEVIAWVETDNFRSLISGPLNSVFGRKRLVIFGNVLFIGGAFMMAFSPAGTMVFIMLGRVVVGLAMGMQVRFSVHHTHTRYGLPHSPAVHCRAVSC